MIARQVIASEFTTPVERPRHAAAAFVGVFALTLLALAYLIVRGQGTLAAGSLLLAAFYLLILLRWQLGVYGLLICLPFTGAVTLSLYPWEGAPILNPVLYKDWLFVLPVYVGFLGALFLGRTPAPRLGRVPAALLLAFSVLVLAQTANPGVTVWLMALIGVKVWLFYLPLYPVGFALISTRRDLVVLLRLLVALASIPCIIGIAEYVCAQLYGYQDAMDMIYGNAASQATQSFSHFEVGGGLIARIPSTFTFVTQFSGFTLAMLVPCYAAWRSDPSRAWRRVSGSTLVLVTVAAFLSGARATFVFVPLLLGLMYGLDRGFSGLLRGAVYTAGALLGAMAILRVSVAGLFDHMSELFREYAVGTAYGGLVTAVTTAPLGAGTGTNTGPARYALPNPELFIGIENYYAKVAYELGIAGLLIVWGLVAALIWQGMRGRTRLRDPGLRACCVVILAFLVTMSLNSFKGWLIDLDPINVYFWVFAGVLAKLPYLDRQNPEDGRERHSETVGAKQ